MKQLIDEDMFRTLENRYGKVELDWKPKISTLDLAKEMVAHDLTIAKKEKFLIDNGF